MSCNGCRILRKGCSETCILRPSLQWIDTAEAQAHATVFVAKFFGRAALISFLSNVSPIHRPAVFQSLLYEACGRTVNPVNGAVGLMSSGNWHICQAAVDTVLRGGILRPIPDLADRIGPFPVSDDVFDAKKFPKRMRSGVEYCDNDDRKSASFDLSLAPPETNLGFDDSQSRNSSEEESATTRESSDSGFVDKERSKTTTLLLFS